MTAARRGVLTSLLAGAGALAGAFMWKLRPSAADSRGYEVRSPNLAEAMDRGAADRDRADS
jgi:hypothetical protein